MSRGEKEKALLDKLSRSEENNMKRQARECIGFSILGNMILLVSCIADSRDILYLQNTMIKFILLVGLFVFLIGCGCLVSVVCYKDDLES